jgi:hypothetical protein
MSLSLDYTDQILFTGKHAAQKRPTLEENLNHNCSRVGAIPSIAPSLGHIPFWMVPMLGETERATHETPSPLSLYCHYLLFLFLGRLRQQIVSLN